jgi:transcriptional regulator with XRE-family HTH domain
MANRIREIRQEKNISGTDVAAKLGMSVQHYYDLEKGKKALNIKRAKELAEYFDVKLSYLLGEDDEQPSADLTKEVTKIVGEILGKSYFIEPDHTADELRHLPIINEPGKSETIPLNWLTEAGEYIFYRVKDEAMSGARIQTGDLLLVHKASDVPNGATALVEYGGELIARKVHKAGVSLVLSSANTEFDPLVGEAKIVGRVVQNVINF